MYRPATAATALLALLATPAWAQNIESSAGNLTATVIAEAWTIPGRWASCPMAACW